MDKFYDFVGPIFTTFGDNLPIFFGGSMCLVFLYMALLLVRYLSFVRSVVEQNNRVAEKAGIILFHNFSYSWRNGVRATVVFPPPKNEVMISKKEGEL